MIAKPYINVVSNGEGTLVFEHANESLADKQCAELLTTTNLPNKIVEVRQYKFVKRATSKLQINFDGGIDDRIEDKVYPPVPIVPA